jgi:MarR-like DNA-binding transcriptional regulator SgrR of sgrS sRNA
MSKYLRVRDVADELHCSRRHATTLMKMEMPHLDIGLGTSPRIRVSREEFDAWKARKVEQSVRKQADQAALRAGVRLAAKAPRRGSALAAGRQKSALASKDKPQTHISQPRREAKPKGEK